MPLRILVAIPAFNEDKFIGVLLDGISATVPIDHIVVVNDGSTDRTGELARSAGIRVIDHKKNQGKGEAIKTAFSFAWQNNFEWIIFLDGDGQHPPWFIQQFIGHIYNDNVDVVLGNRQSRSEKMPIHRQLSNGVTSILVSLCGGGPRILDSQCGFRAVRVRNVKNIKLESSGFQVESELLIKLAKAGASFKQIPITTVYGGESSSIRLVFDTLKFMKLILKSLWW